MGSIRNKLKETLLKNGVLFCRYWDAYVRVKHPVQWMTEIVSWKSSHWWKKPGSVRTFWTPDKQNKMGWNRGKSRTGSGRSGEVANNGWRGHGMSKWMLRLEVTWRNARNVGWRYEKVKQSRIRNRCSPAKLANSKVEEGAKGSRKIEKGQRGARRFRNVEEYWVPEETLAMKEVKTPTT
jgi:hypothetical protein